MTSVKSRATATVLATAAAVAAFGTGSSSAGSQAETTVTIRNNGGDFFGRVRSDDTPRCTVGRTVVLLKKKPGRDAKIGTDTTGDDGRWNTGNSGQTRGRFYAKAKADPDCASDKSEVIRLSP